VGPGRPSGVTQLRKIEAGRTNSPLGGLTEAAANRLSIFRRQRQQQRQRRSGSAGKADRGLDDQPVILPTIGRVFGDETELKALRQSFRSVIKTGLTGRSGGSAMRQKVLGTLTIGQAPRPDVTPIIDRHVPVAVRRIHRGVLDGLSPAQIDARFIAGPGEPVLVTRLRDGKIVELSRRRIREGVQDALSALEAEGCDVILLLCTGMFESLECNKAWLVEPDHIIPGIVAGLVERRRLGIVVPIASQIGSESGKWRSLPTPPIFASACPYSADTEPQLRRAGMELTARGAAAILMDCIGFTDRHRAVLQPLGIPVILSNAVAAKAVSELLGG
jgi:protein AroM